MKNRLIAFTSRSRASVVAGTAGTGLLGSALLATLWSTSFDHRWIVFLAGILAAACLALVSRGLNSRWLIARRNAQVKVLRSKLATEARLRAHADESLARIRSGVQFVDEALPAMLAYVDTQERVRYHNHAYRRWTGRDHASIDGRAVEEIVGPLLYREIRGRLREALEGREVRYERVQPLPGRGPCRMLAHYLPTFDADGDVAGIFVILNDLGAAEQREPAPEPQPDDAPGQLLAALHDGAFSLYCQVIAPLGRRGAGPIFQEVQLRLKEEEEKHLPPGAFLAVAEEHGLMHEVDRWVVARVAAHAGRDGDSSVYVIRLGTGTLGDAGFAGHVSECAARHDIDPGRFCFELSEAELFANLAAAGELITALRRQGCRFAMSGVGSGTLAFDLLKDLRVDYLKLDGGMVVNMLRTPRGLAAVRDINRAAHNAGILTVAECVESDGMRSALARIETDFAQGTGIGLPRAMEIDDACRVA